MVYIRREGHLELIASDDSDFWAPPIGLRVCDRLGHGVQGFVGVYLEDHGT